MASGLGSGVVDGTSFTAGTAGATGSVVLKKNQQHSRTHPHRYAVMDGIHNRDYTTNVADC